MLTISIQAGGASRRMGQDKALMPFLGRPLILRLVERLRPFADRLIVTTNRPQEYAFLDAPLYPDVQPGVGALGGLLTALSVAETPFVALAACDMPFASGALLRFGAERLAATGGDVFIPRSAHGLEPLHAVYRRETCLDAVQAALAAGQRRMISWFSSVQVEQAGRDLWGAFDPDGVLFLNVNTPEEFRAAEALAQRRPSL